MKKVLFMLVLMLMLSACEGEEMKPIIDLHGDQTITIEAGVEYIETATAMVEDEEVDVTISGNVDTSTPGTYTIIYSCEIDGAKADQLTRVVTVVDTTPPTITFLSTELEYGEELATLYTINDHVDSEAEIQLDISNLESLTSLGTKTLDFTMTDTAGNSTTISKTITVVDTAPPVVTFSDYDTFVHEKGAPFNYHNVLYSDNYDKNEDITLHYSGTVDVNTLGTYDITYYAEDSNGNQSTTIVKTITVVDVDSMLSAHHRFLSDNLTFFNPEPFLNGYIHQATETVYGGVLIENGAYTLHYYMFFHNFFNGTKVLNAFEFTCQTGDNVRIDLADNKTDFVFEIPLQCLQGINLQVTTYAHDDYVSDTRQWTANFSFRKQEYLDPVYLLDQNSQQGYK